jgi:serine/threonine protein kinase
MDAADRNLNQIYVQEQPDLSGLRTILTQVFEAVAHLHEKELMHGDLKLLNVVRFRRDNRLRLIDFDASAKIVPSGVEDK